MTSMQLMVWGFFVALDWFSFEEDYQKQWIFTMYDIVWPSSHNVDHSHVHLGIFFMCCRV